MRVLLSHTDAHDYEVTIVNGGKQCTICCDAYFNAMEFAADLVRVMECEFANLVNPEAIGYASDFDDGD